GEWREDGSDSLDSECINWCTALLWIVPAKVGGTWRLPRGELTLKQSYQFISGTLNDGNQVTPIANGKLKGDQILFNAGGVVYAGQVSGDSMQGTLSSGGNWTATRAK
ncbi:MAG TPA: SAM-dependent methyltransferase, partial [Candidatus Binatia bacterium]|nr:SAM-dependent methyltransferase [Candidatus Binatia bacterium]